MSIHAGGRGPGHLARVTGGFSPADLGASLLGWWDAERPDRITQSGGAVGAWTDIVGSYSATQAVSGAKPAYSATSFNGRPGVSFDGTDDELTLASVPFPTGAAACEMWALVDQAGLVADGMSRFAFGYGGTTSLRRRISRSVTSGVNRASTGTGDGVGETTVGNGLVELSGRHVMRGIVRATETETHVDGVASAPGALVPATANTRTRLGASSSGSATGFWQGAIAAVLVTTLLSDAQAGQLTAYLKARGGIA